MLAGPTAHVTTSLTAILLLASTASAQTTWCVDAAAQDGGDFNLFLANHPGANGQPFTAGDPVWAQGWFRDPPSPAGSHLTDGLQFTVGP